MITKCSRLSVSNNESIGNISLVSNCDREASIISSSEPSNEDPPAGNSELKSVVLDSHYIETKIKSLLNQEDDNGSEPSAEKLENDEAAAKVAPSAVEQPERITGILTAEDSCNAVDNQISSGEGETSQLEVPPEELSFNGKIRSLNAPPSGGGSSQCELTDATKGFEKVRQDKLNESYEMLTKENSSLMHYNNEKSPDLFADDDDDDDDDHGSCHDDARSDNGDATDSENIPANNSTTVSLNPVEQIERKLLKKLQASLSGVLPPPSVTYSRIDVSQMLSLYQQNEERLFYRNDEIVVENSTETGEAIPSSPACLSKPTHPPRELNELEWPNVLTARAHGVYYNHSAVTEKIELLGLKYVERYIGRETNTSFDVSRAPPSAKKKMRLKLLNKSPGSRLSHLARRRATFSSANLLNSSAGSSSSGGGSSLAGNQRRLCNRQIVLDTRKSDNRRKSKGRTPKRRTPGRRKTPGSSAKKRTLSLPVVKPSQALSREAPKRALFQSPPDEPAPKVSSHASPSVSRTAASSKTQKLKRVLFSPPVKRRLALSAFGGAGTEPTTTTNVTNPSDSSGIKNISTGESVDLDSGVPGRKRKRPADEADEDLVQRQKMSRNDPVKKNDDLTPRSSKLLRSQSFCLGSQTKVNRSALESSGSGRTLVRANSESVTLTENHRKKLLWAVSQALQSKQISMKHENFRKFASILAHVVKKLFLEFNDHSVSSTSEKMLRLAHKHLFDVLQGQTAEEIYQRERTRLLNARNLLKPHGYISPEEYERNKLRRSKSTSVFILDNSNDCSFGTAGCSSQPPPPVPLSQSSSVFSQSSEFLAGLSQSSSFQSSQPAAGSESTKNTILRENIDSEQRQKSSQKQISFSGKDQKNMSPYADIKSGSQAKAKLLVGGAAMATSILKAKRQISFE
ncbi:hypothetical protein RP20_CCG020336 [Aedes albopictus]|nr:uncharacterized protein LOC109407996 isoform X2 [Aedes albopictus]KXJ71532.1 hypothetical protein RP20_CCG020336 [Aedes albopictus]